MAKGRADGEGGEEGEKMEKEKEEERCTLSLSSARYAYLT